MAHFSNIKVGEELFLDCGRHFVFLEVNIKVSSEKSKMKTEAAEYIADQEQICNDVKNLPKPK